MEVSSKDKKIRFWASWYSGNYADEGCTKPPFKFWVSGQASRRQEFPQTFSDGREKDDCTICASIDANNEEDVWKLVSKHFPDYNQRFINRVDNDWAPGTRFQ